MTLQAQIRKGLLWTATQQWGVQAIRMAVLLVLARLVSPGAFGVFALASTIIGFVHLLHGQGLTAAITQKAKLEDDARGSALASLLAGSMLATVAVACVAPLLERASMPQLTPLLQVLSLQFPLNAVSGAAVALWRRDLCFRHIAAVTTASQLIASVLSILLALRGFGLWSLAARTLVEAVLMLAFTAHAAPWSSLRRASWAAYRDLLRFSLPMAGGNLLSLGRTRLDEVVIGAVLGVEALGYYSLARRQTDSMASLLPAVVGNALLPILARVQGNAAEVRAVMLRGVGLIGALTLPTLGAMGASAAVWVPLLLGERWRPVIPMMFGFTIVATTRALVGFNLITLPATGHPGKRLIAELATSALTLAALFATVSLGIQAVVLASAGVLLVLTPLELLWAGRWLPVTLSDQVRALQSPALAASVVIAAALVMRHTAVVDRPVISMMALTLVTAAAIAVAYRTIPSLEAVPSR